jgi:hypothetical protein
MVDCIEVVMMDRLSLKLPVPLFLSLSAFWGSLKLARRNEPARQAPYLIIGCIPSFLVKAYMREFVYWLT